MNIVNKLTLRHIKTHKRRSVLTVLAIIVSVAMVTAVFTSAFSFVKFMQDATLAYDGNWHTQFVYEESPELSAFQNNNDIENFYVSAEYTMISCNTNSDSQRVRADIDTVDPSVVDIRHINIAEGSFPKTENEILLTKEYLENNKLNWKVGDTVTLAVSLFNGETYHNEEYVLSGIADGNVSYFDHCAGCLLNTGAFPDGVTQFVTVSFKKLDNSVYDKSSALMKASGAESYKTNNDLLNFSGVMKNNDILYSLGGFAAVILAVIVIASVVMIYDSFAVSYQERERYLGMLASVGATKRQKRRSIYFEGFILGAVAIPVGITSGFIGMGITFNAIQDSLLKTANIPIHNTLKVHFSPYILIGTIIISTLTIFVSCYIPARSASKTTPIAAIKGTNTVKVKKARRLRVPRLTRKLYGFEGELAVKNFKRNGKRSRNIVFALVMSVVLFMTVTNFAVMLDTLVKMEAGGERPDFSVTVNAENIATAEKCLEKAEIKRFTGYAFQRVYLNSTELFTEDGRRYLTDERGEGANLVVCCLDNASFDRYLESLGENPQKYHDKSSPKALLFNHLKYTQDKETKTAKAFNTGEGDVLQCVSIVYEDGVAADGKTFSFEAGAVTEMVPKDTIFPPEELWEPSAVFPADTYFALLSGENNYITYGVFADNYKAVVSQTEDYLEQQGVFYSLNDNGANLEAVKALTNILKVFVYGFISLITLIAIINIINSIANSMNERKTEFAMLKSVGVTPRGFKKMIYVESLRYGIKSLMWSVPVSAALHWLMYYALSTSEDMRIPFSMNLPYYAAAIFAVFIIILLSLLYSADKIKDDNIIENLKQD